VRSSQQSSETTQTLNVPLALEQVSVLIKNNSVTALRYNLTNTSKTPLVAVVLRLDLYDDSSSPQTVGIKFDTFIGGADLLANRSWEHDLKVGLTTKSRPRRAELSVTFAEFRSGAFFGSADTDTALKKSWTDNLAVYSALRAALLTPGLSADESEQRVRDLLSETSVKQKCPDAVAVISDVLKTQGLQAVKERLASAPQAWW
jgi:hypothetical protein